MIIVFIVAGVLLIGLAILGWLKNSGPSVAMFGRIGKAICEAKKHALENVTTQSESTGIDNVDLERAQKQSVRVNDIIRFIYTIETVPEGFLHLISSQLCKPKSKKYQIQCMLVVMLELNRQLADAGIEEGDVQFEVDESELGTQYLGMQLTPEQHKKFSEIGLGD